MESHAKCQVRINSTNHMRLRTILLSVISLLNEPNVHSAAHVDASVAYRKWKESNGVQDEYERVVTSLVKATHEEAKRDGVTVPTTLEEYCVSGRSTSKTFYQCGDTDELSDYDDHNEYYGSDEDDYDNVSIDVEDEKINSTKESQLSAKIDSGVDDPCISKGVNSGESSRVVDHRISSDYSRVTSPS
uniref:Ubiquitin coniugating enzyme 3b n=1 Tax=Schistosoma japonicum TaxID=6182 RepID=C1LI21_SCHJA|nr:ubiquitin coniugating enzyme 3b [Schistosoma japonicum]